MTDLMELASRVEAGEGPDRELDAAIWLHLPEQEGHAWKHGGDRYKHAHQIAGCGFVPAYTGSLDAAMSLVSKGVGDDFLRADLTRTYQGEGRCVLLDTLSGDDWYGEARTLPVAICVAALRARAHQGTAHVEQ